MTKCAVQRPEDSESSFCAFLCLAISYLKLGKEHFCLPSPHPKTFVKCQEFHFPSYCSSTKFFSKRTWTEAVCTFCISFLAYFLCCWETNADFSPWISRILSMPFFTVCLSVCPILWWHKRCLTHGTLSVPNQAQKSGIIWCSFPKLCYNIGMLQNWMRKLYVFHCFWCCPAQRPFAFLMVGHLMHNCSMSCAKKAFFSFISPKCAVLLQNSDKLCNVNYY